jgi:hypothetical protein
MGENHIASTMSFLEKEHGVLCQDPTKLWNWIGEFPKFKQANAVQEAKADVYKGMIETMVDTESPRTAFNAINQLEIKRANLDAERLDDNGINMNAWQRSHRYKFIEAGTWKQIAKSSQGSEEKRSKTFGAIVAAMGENHIAATMPFFEKEHGVLCQDQTKLWDWIGEFPKFKQANAVQEELARD